MRILFLLSVCATFTFARTCGQALGDIPFKFTSEDDNRLIKEDDSLRYYVASDDSAQVVCISEELSYYQLFSKSNKLIADGSFIIEGDKYLQDGKWTERYPGGKTKIAGYYRRNKPIGTWQEYYPDGKVKMLYNYGIFVEASGMVSSCLSGSYQEFYENGKLKINGFYSANMTNVPDTETISDPVDGHDVLKVYEHQKLKHAKTGHWEYYTESGDLDKKKDY